MSATFEKLSSNKVKINFVVSPEEFGDALKLAHEKYGKNYTVPGFRKGRAPRNLIEIRYGASVFYEEAFEMLFPGVYAKALSEFDIDAVDRPELDVEQIGAGKELIFSVEVFVRPDVVLGDYTDLKAEKIVAEVTDDDVSAELERARERIARYVDVTDRPAQLDDQVNIDFAGFDGERAFEGGSAEGHVLTLGSGTFIPGFEEQLVGVSAGEEVEINVTFPEDYREQSLAGKPVVFKVKLNGIQRKEIPALDDDFAKDVSEYDTLDEYKSSVRAELVKQAEARAENAFENELIEQIVSKTEIDIPDAMIEEAVTNLVNNMSTRMAAQGIYLEEYLDHTGQTMEQLRDMYRGQAAERVKAQLTLEAICDEEGITATDDEVKEEIKKISEDRKKPYDDVAAQFANDPDAVSHSICMKKVVDILKRYATN